MSIPIVSMNAGDGLQHSQKATLPAAGNSVQRTASTARAASAPDNISRTPAAKAAADAKEAEAAKPTTKQIQESLQEINKVMAGLSISVQFKIDPDYKELIVKVVDQDSGKLIRQIPTEDVVKMSKAMDNLKGLLFAQSA
ncbi:flagellar protein FlaG [Polaromonas sp. DSR2-3-2]|uniref:flagellar protein FlaG n=1 Tax=unclassified Polaromonas TaxID=2638319 RepID=UPI003CF64C56